MGIGLLSVLLATLNAMPSELPPHLRELAQFQQGILTKGQARQGGLTKDVIRSRVRQGRWQRVHAGVYAMSSGEPGRAAVLWAAVLRAGPGAMLSHHTAAELAALTDAPSMLIHVTIPDSRRIASISRTRDPPVRPGEPAPAPGPGPRTDSSRGDCAGPD